MTFTLGYTPEKFKLEISAGSDFSASLRRTDGTDWPTGASLEIDFADVAPTWTATLAGDTATFTVDEVVIDALIAAKPRKIKLFYVEGQTRLLWGNGALVVS